MTIRLADRDLATARAFAADRSLFCADRSHPSSAGYAVIADALYPAVAAALAAQAEPTSTTVLTHEPVRRPATMNAGQRLS